MFTVSNNPKCKCGKNAFTYHQHMGETIFTCKDHS